MNTEVHCVHECVFWSACVSSIRYRYLFIYLFIYLDSITRPEKRASLQEPGSKKRGGKLKGGRGGAYFKGKKKVSRALPLRRFAPGAPKLRLLPAEFPTLSSFCTL